MKKVDNPLGAHVSAAGGFLTAVREATELGLDCFQFFSRPPQGGTIAAITPDRGDEFKKACQQGGFTAYIHAPYVINLASAVPRIRHSSIEILKNELERANTLGVQAIITHLGSAKDVTPEKGLEMVTEGVREIIADYAGDARFLLEISAGAGNVIGDEFEEVAVILDAVRHERLGVCFDTAHAFASGYDLVDAEAVAKTLQRFDKTIGLGHLHAIHLNDSKVGLGENKDRHEHLGLGKIGLIGLRSFITHPGLAGLPMILETPPDEKRLDDIRCFRDIQAGSI